jgi:hypothetical protein
MEIIKISLLSNDWKYRFLINLLDLLIIPELQKKKSHVIQLLIPCRKIHSICDILPSRYKRF